MSTDKSISKLTEMVKRGSNYREEYEFELYGEPVVAVIRPLKDDEFLPVAAFLAEHFEMEDEIDGEEAVSEAIDEVAEARQEGGEGEPIDVSKLDEEFVGIMQHAAILGMTGQKTPEGEVEEFETEEQREGIVQEMMGGYSVELGGKVLEISGDVRDAEKFRGGRGSV